MFFIFVLYLVGISLYLDYTTWWFDMVMHFLGGFWEGLFFIWFFSPRDSSPRSLLKVFLFVLVVGVIWEFFQIYVNNYIAKYPFDTMDTISDVCFDLAGGAFAVFYFFKKRIMGKGGYGI